MNYKKPRGSGDEKRVHQANDARAHASYMLGSTIAHLCNVISNEI